jgi:hypothetical protein
LVERVKIYVIASRKLNLHNLMPVIAHLLDLLLPDGVVPVTFMAGRAQSSSVALVV